MVSLCPDPTAAVREQQRANDYTRHVILKLRPAPGRSRPAPDVDDGGLGPLLAQLEGRRIDCLSDALRGIVALHIGKPGLRIGEAIARLGAQPGVEWAEGNAPARLCDEPYRSPRPPRWGLDYIDAPAARDRIKVPPSRTVTVAVVDWGAFSGHRDLDGYRIEGTRVIDPASANITDDNGHGTMLVGAIASIMEEVLRPKPARRHVEILAAKFIDARTLPTAAAAARAIDWAIGEGARVINASWDVGIDNKLVLREAIARAEKAGVLFVAAAGNSGRDNVQDRVLPASYDLPNVISVMAMDRHGRKPGFSNYGANVHIAAPGVGIGSLRPYLRATPKDWPWRDSTAYGAFSGTSVAAAQVSAAAALLLLADPSLTPTDIREILIASATPSPALKRLCQAGGTLNLLRAIETLAQKRGLP